MLPHSSTRADPLAPNAHITARMRIRAWRKALVARLPWIKRARHQKLLRDKQTRSNHLADALLDGPTHATQTPIFELMPIQRRQCDELCLFVTFASQPIIKTHVIDHIQSLVNSGIQVILIVNTGLSAEQLQIPNELREKLNGCLIRNNCGYDFAAWAHAYTLIDKTLVTRRLYFVNDSIVGPIDSHQFELMLEKFRSLPGDMNGLTESLEQLPHLQSFFLAFTPLLFNSDIFERFINGVINFSDKQQVIELYEVHLTRFIRKHGFRCEALFPKSPIRPACNDDTIQNWAGLIERGFPYVKASVLKHAAHAPELKALVPPKYWTAL